MTPSLRRLRGLTKEPAKVTDFVVYASIGAFIAWTAWQIVPTFKGRMAVLVYLAYEGVVLANKYLGDTLSESVERLSANALIPWLFCAATFVGIEEHIIWDPSIPRTIWSVFVAGALNAHWFFRMKQAQEKAEVKKAVDAIKESDMPAGDKVDAVAGAVGIGG